MENIEKKVDDKVVIIYNPYSRELSAYFMNHDVMINDVRFESSDDWQVVYHPVNKDEYLHIQLDYDQTAQLIVYYRYTEDNGLLDNCDSWHSGTRQSDNIFIAQNDLEFEMFKVAVRSLEFYPKSRYLKMK